MEEANAGDAGCSGRYAGRGGFESDASECVDRDGRSQGADCVELVEALSSDRNWDWDDSVTGDNFFEGDNFFKDWGEEDGVCFILMGALHVFRGVAGDCDDRLGQIR